MFLVFDPCFMLDFCSILCSFVFNLYFQSHFVFSVGFMAPQNGILTVCGLSDWAKFQFSQYFS